MAASVADAAAVNPNGIETLLANGLNKFSIKGNPIFCNVPESLPKNPPHCHILCNWVFDNFILVEELFGKSLRSFEIYVLVINNLRAKLFSSLKSPRMLECLAECQTMFPFEVSCKICALKHNASWFHVEVVVIVILAQ